MHCRQLTRVHEHTREPHGTIAVRFRPTLASPFQKLRGPFYRFEIRFACFYFRFIHISTLRRNIWPGNCIRTLVEVPQQEGWSLVTGTVSNCYRKSLSLSVL